MTCGIYKIINTVNGKFYLGSSKDVEKRWTIHKQKLANNNHCNPHLQFSYNKYGIENFIMEIVEIVEKSKLILKEQYYIDLLTPYDDKIGMNISKYAGGGDTISNHPNKKILMEKQKTSINKHYESLTDEEKRIKYTSKGNLGHKWTDEMKEKSRISHLSQTPTEEQKIKTSKTLKDGYKTGRLTPTKGMLGKNISDLHKQRISENNSKKISIDGVIYKSITEAQKILKISYNIIHWRLNSDKYCSYFYIN